VNKTEFGHQVDDTVTLRDLHGDWEIVCCFWGEEDIDCFFLERDIGCFVTDLDNVELYGQLELVKSLNEVSLP
jgi:hypothetical protein